MVESGSARRGKHNVTMTPIFLTKLKALLFTTLVRHCQTTEEE
jgi:hypothetical protein